MKTVLRKQGIETITFDKTGKRSTTKKKKYYDYYGIEIVDQNMINLLKIYDKSYKKRKRSDINKEVCQEAVIRLLDKKLEKPEHIFNKVKRNVTVDKWSKQNNKAERFTELSEDLEYINDYKAIKSYRETIKYISSKLSKDENKLFELYHIENIKQYDIAKKLGIDRKTVTRKLKKLNSKIHKMKVKELYYTPFVAPINKDKKHGKYRPIMPSIKIKKYKSRTFNKTIVNHIEAATVKRENGPWKGQIAHIYSYPISQKKQYENKKIEYKASKKVNNIENLPCNFIGTNFFTPIVNKPLFDDLSYIAVASNSSIEYKAIKRSYDYKANLNNVYGSCYNHNTIDIKAHGRASGLIDKIKNMYAINQIKISCMAQNNLI